MEIKCLSDIDKWFDHHEYYSYTHNGIQYANCGYFHIYSMPTESDWFTLIKRLNDAYKDKNGWWKDMDTRAINDEVISDFLSSFSVHSWG